MYFNIVKKTTELAIAYLYFNLCAKVISVFLINLHNCLKAKRKIFLIDRSALFVLFYFITFLKKI
jgi:hypothetical protein